MITIIFVQLHSLETCCHARPVDQSLIVVDSCNPVIYFRHTIDATIDILIYFLPIQCRQLLILSKTAKSARVCYKFIPAILLLLGNPLSNFILQGTYNTMATTLDGKNNTHDWSIDKP